MRYYRLSVILDHEPRNALRLQFLDSLQAWVDKTGPPNIKAIIDSWILSSALKIIQSLHEPTMNDVEHVMLMTAAIKYGHGRERALLVER